MSFVFFSPSFDKKIREILENNTFDIIHIESLFITPYIHTVRRFSKGKIVLRAHNIEHKLWQDKSKATLNPFKKIYLRFLHKKLKHYELNILKNIDAVAAISPVDQKYLSALTDKPISLIPLGVDLKKQSPKRHSSTIKLFHIGAMDWVPNKEAIDWFLENVWVGIRNKYPTIELHLAGKNISKDYHLPHQNVFCHGEVESASKFIQKHDILIIPLKTASGLRIKIIEAMALGKVVVSTSIGIDGIKATDKIHYLKADTVKEFEDAITFIVSNDKTRMDLESNAMSFISENFDKETVTTNLVSFYKSIL